MEKNKVKLICKQCGEDDVIMYAQAIWNAEAQAFEFDTPDYNGLEYCNTCGEAEAHLEFISISEE